jgi:hypothetical protein
MKPITEKEAVITIECLEECARVRGNAIASGDDQIDRNTEDLLLEELDSGNQWAWCTVRVVATWNELEGDDYLGCCSYKDEQDFINNSGYFEDMKARALQELNEKVAAVQRCA